VLHFAHLYKERRFIDDIADSRIEIGSLTTKVSLFLVIVIVALKLNANKVNKVNNLTAFSFLC